MYTRVVDVCDVLKLVEMRKTKENVVSRPKLVFVTCGDFLVVFRFGSVVKCSVLCACDGRDYHADMLWVYIELQAEYEKRWHMYNEMFGARRHRQVIITLYIEFTTALAAHTPERLTRRCEIYVVYPARDMKHMITVSGIASPSSSPLYFTLHTYYILPQTMGLESPISDTIVYPLPRFIHHAPQLNMPTSSLSIIVPFSVRQYVES